jgi:hypothetical protein
MKSVGGCFLGCWDMQSLMLQKFSRPFIAANDVVCGAVQRDRLPNNKLFPCQGCCVGALEDPAMLFIKLSQRVHCW